ncbi:MAG: hypothetical protein J6Z49_04540 [Kiritimatiellae bacterium]|nr:hypothetical protein [Kiritimatiellia bacterium]
MNTFTWKDKEEDIVTVAERTAGLFTRRPEAYWWRVATLAFALSLAVSMPSLSATARYA